MYTGGTGEGTDVYAHLMQLPGTEQRLRCWCTGQYLPLSWPMADWFMEECMMLSDWTLGGRGGIWLPAAQKLEKTGSFLAVRRTSLFQPDRLSPGTAAGDSGPVREGVTLAGEPTGEGEGPRMPGR